MSSIISAIHDAAFDVLKAVTEEPDQGNVRLFFNGSVFDLIMDNEQFAGSQDIGVTGIDLSFRFANGAKLPKDNDFVRIGAMDSASVRYKVDFASYSQGSPIGRLTVSKASGG